MPKYNAKSLHKLPRTAVQTLLNVEEEILFDDLEIVVLENLEPVDFGRQASREAVHLILTFLKNRGLSRQAMKPLIDVFNALKDVEEGKLPELFDPKSGRNSGPEGVVKWSRSSGSRQLKIYSAACMGALIAGKVSKKIAASDVAEKVQAWPKFSSGIINTGTITYWRDQFLQRMPSNRERVAYESIVRQFTNGPKAASFLKEVLEKGPPLTGGMRKAKT